MCELVGRNLPYFGRNILSSRSGSYTRLYDVTLQQTVGLFVKRVECISSERKDRENYPRRKRVENIPLIYVYKTHILIGPHFLCK